MKKAKDQGTNGMDVRPSRETQMPHQKPSGMDSERPKRSHRDQVHDARDFAGRNTKQSEAWIGQEIRR